MKLMDKAKQAALAAAVKTGLGYLEKDPEVNIPKLMELVDKFVPDGWYESQRNAIRNAIQNKDSNWYKLILRIYELDPGVREAFFTNFIINASLKGSALQEETAEEIRNLYEKTGYIIDTHTAVATGVYHKYLKDTKDTDTKTVIASTASPFKFTRSVMDAIDKKYDAMTDFELVDELSKIGNVKIPNAIEEIRTAEVRHKTVCEVDEMPKVVKEFLNVK